MNDSVKHGIGLEDGYDGVYLTRVHGKMPFIPEGGSQKEADIIIKTKKYLLFLNIIFSKICCD